MSTDQSACLLNFPNKEDPCTAKKRSKNKKADKKRVASAKVKHAFKSIDNKTKLRKALEKKATKERQKEAFRAKDKVMTVKRNFERTKKCQTFASRP